MKNSVTHYDVTLIYAAYAKSGKIQMASSKETFADLFLCMPTINNKTIIEWGWVRYEELLRPRFALSASAFGR